MQIKSIDSSNQIKQASTWLMAFLLLILMSAVVVIHLRMSQWIANVDLKMYALGAHELLQGRLLYTDIWDLKPPGIWITFMGYEWLFGYGQHEFTIMAITCNILIILGIYRAGIVSGLGQWAGFMGALFWTLQCGDVNLELHNTNAEYFINIWMIWAWVGMLSLICRKSGRTVSVAVGLCLLCASLYKHSIVIGMVPMALTYLLVRYKMGQFKTAMVDVLIWGGTGIIGWGIVFGYFAAMGRFDDVYFTLITYSQFYGGDLLKNLAAKSTFYFWFELMGHIKALILLFALNLIALMALTQRGRWDLAVMLIGWMGFAYLSSFLLRDIFEHYFQYWIPVLCLGAGWGIVSLLQVPGRVPRWCLVVGMVWFVTGVLFTQIPYWTGTQQQYEQSTIKRKIQVEARNLGLQLRKELKPQDAIFLWGHGYESIFVSQTRMTSGIIMPNCVMRGPFSQRLTRMVANNLKDHPPKRVIVCDYWLKQDPARRKHVVTKWIMQNFDLMPESDTYTNFSIWKPRMAISELPAIQ